MIDRRAVPGFVACLVGGVASAVAILTEQVWLLAVAVVAALAAGVAILELAGNLRRSLATSVASAEQAETAQRDSDRMAARAAKLEAEMLATRHADEKAERAERAEVPNPAPDPAGGTNPAATIEPSLLDTESTLFNEAFFIATLDKRVLAARRGLRPLALVLIESVTGFGSDEAAPAPARAMAEGITATLRESDIACRLDDGRYGLLLEDTPENGAVWTTERVRRHLDEVIPGHTMWAGIACYPAHAFGAGEIMEKSREALVTAKDWPQDRIEVSLVPDD